MSNGSARKARKPLRSTAAKALAREQRFNRIGRLSGFKVSARLSES